MPLNEKTPKRRWPTHTCDHMKIPLLHLPTTRLCAEELADSSSNRPFVRLDRCSAPKTSQHHNQKEDEPQPSNNPFNTIPITSSTPLPTHFCPFLPFPLPLPRCSPKPSQQQMRSSKRI